MYDYRRVGLLYYDYCYDYCYHCHLTVIIMTSFMTYICTQILCEEQILTQIPHTTLYDSMIRLYDK
jgi:hypothetical protein